MSADDEGMAMDGDVQGVEEISTEVPGARDGQDEAVEGAQEDQAQLEDARYRAALARIEELEGQVEAAAKTAEREKKLRSEINGLKRQAESDRIEFELRLAGARNVKAARAVLTDHDGSVDALKEAEPWLFETPQAPTAVEVPDGTTGLRPDGLSDGGDDVRRWRELAGLEDDVTP